MVLEAVEDRDRWEMTLRRVSGHGFLEFEGKYTLTPRAGGATYLSYSVELVPCPIFPLPRRRGADAAPAHPTGVRCAVAHADSECWRGDRGCGPAWPARESVDCGDVIIDGGDR